MLRYNPRRLRQYEWKKASFQIRCKARSLSSSLSRAPSPCSPSLNSSQGKKVEKCPQSGVKICYLDRRTLERDLFAQSRGFWDLCLIWLLRIQGSFQRLPEWPPLLGTLVGVKSGITWRGPKMPFPNLRWLKLSYLNFCAGRVPGLFHPSLCRALKLTFPADVGGIVTDGRITTDIGTGSLEQSVGHMTSTEFRPPRV